MTCSDFLARYSEFRDRDLSDADRKAFEAHLGACGSCERYHYVVSRGVSLLRTLPAQRLRDDFQDRLRHSLYHLEETRRLRRHRPHGASGAGAMFVAAAAMIVLAVIVTPTLLDEPTPSVELAPVVAEAPAEATATSRIPSAFTVRAGERPSLVYESDLWTGSNALLFEHSALYQRHRSPTLVRAGIQ